MEKNIDYYLNLPYTRELIPEPSGIWFVQIKELPNCMSQGNSPEEALRNIDEAMLGWLKSELEDGDEIPEPKAEEEYSGNFRLRIPKSLHGKLVRVADEQGVSLNAYCSTMLGLAVGQKPTVRRHESFSELANNMECLLRAYKADINEDQSVESQFANWLNGEFDEFYSAYHSGDTEGSLGQLDFLSRTLKKSCKGSPLLEMVSNLFSYLRQSLAALAMEPHGVIDEQREEAGQIYRIDRGLLSKQQLMIQVNPQTSPPTELFTRAKKGKR